MIGSFDMDSLFRVLCWIVVMAPLVGLLAMGVIAAFALPVGELKKSRLTQSLVGVGLVAALAILASMVATGRSHVEVELGRWVELPSAHFHFTFKFVFDRLSMPFLILSLVLSGVVAAFTRVYLHREPGYRRFYLLYNVFVLGMVLSATAGTVETLFAGWELVGLSSMLLVAFFQERPGPVRSGLRVWIVYRVADAAFLTGAVTLHHFAGAGDLAYLTGTGAWPDGVAPLTAEQALAVGLLMVVAAMGKSALVPFSGWLPRAMEGPTPSSAIFYGALSIHLGAFLLLKIEPLLDRSLLVSAVIVVVGLVTALYASITARTQTDIKSALAFASLTQVGLIVAEIGFGLRYLALVHIVGNACLRTLQLLRAPSLLHDHHVLKNAIGTSLSHSSPQRADDGSRQTRHATRIRRVLYGIGYERAFFDILLNNWLVAPSLELFRRFGAWEDRWTSFLAGNQSPESGRTPEPENHSEESP